MSFNYANSLNELLFNLFNVLNVLNALKFIFESTEKKTEFYLVEVIFFGYFTLFFHFWIVVRYAYKYYICVK